jgi:predicted ATPase
MAVCLRRHDTLMREAIEACRGFVFKTTGDAFCAAFATAPDALAAALIAQRTLLAEDFSAVDGVFVRMALHTGTADERDGDYFGPAVNRVARLLAIGHGGQVLVSSTTADLLQGEIPAPSSLRDLGERRLRDLARPEHVYQLVAPELLDTFPALRSLDDLPNNLPLQLTSFVGREQDVAEIKGLLQIDRLVTLVGSGGSGKTRCAIQVGAELLEDFNDGVWLVELAPISAGSSVAPAIAQALGVRESPNRPLLETVLAYLERRHLLLIADNCEHVLDEARNASVAILRGCSGVRILATSRERLNIAGEHVFRVPSLAVPLSDAVSARAALPYGAVALFADRASAVDARFALTDDNAPEVVEIARRLDGMPLAIELAAARVKVLSPRQLARKLDERFRVLTGGDRSALPRHQTMRALIDWSYDLLSECERALFQKLSIFAGGFTLESASAVGGDEATDEIAVLDLLSSLVDKSLVQADQSLNARYRLLESTRQYAREKLIASGEHPAVARAHATYFLELAQRLEGAYDTMSEQEWFTLAEPELENWRAALDWTLAARADVLLGQRLAGALRRTWAFLTAAEGRRWIIAAQVADATTPAAVAAELDLAEAQLDAMLGLHKASYAAAERALTGYSELGDEIGIAQAQRQVGRGRVILGQIPEGEALLNDALAAFERLGDRTLTGAVLENLAIARMMAGDLAGARAFYARSLALFKATGAERLAAAVASNLAEAEFRGGNAQGALQLASEALASERAQTSSYRIAFRLCNVAAYLVALARYGEAQAYAREALLTARNVQGVAVIWALQHLAATAALRPNDDATSAHADGVRAAQLVGYVDARLVALEAIREYTEQQEYDAMLIVLRDKLGRDECARLMDEGRMWTEQRAVSEALLV